jgi:A/G-specific adenine glycosylase
MSADVRLAPRLLDWYDRCGRRDLPWQRDRDPYRIWVSEIMLQQTQVSTVIPYFLRFTDRFPDIPALASAELDEVLHLWTGLGYYARARNLHRAAGIVCREHAGRFPRDEAEVYRLPGIGRSTAHAILAFAFDRDLPILDGNVKRVLARHFRVHGRTGTAPVERRLWRLAADNTPAERTADYTQAIMDLGATVCVRRRPVCAACPLADTCGALAAGEQAALPTPRHRRARHTRAVCMIMMQANGRVLLQKRPPSGIWGGLWSFPEIEPGENIEPAVLEAYGLHVEVVDTWEVLKHGFTHFNLDIVPVRAEFVRWDDRTMENTELIWYNLSEPDARGLAAPVKKLLQKLR